MNKKKEKPILKITKIDFSNHGYKKYRITGEIFEKKFKANLSDDNKNLNFKILNTGIKADPNTKCVCNCTVGYISRDRCNSLR